MPTPNRLPAVASDDGVWGDILRQYLMKEHFNDDTDNAANGGHQKITIKAGTSSAGTAPIKLTSGTLMTTPEAGAIEFNGDTLYFTQGSGPTRKKLAAYDDASGATGDVYYRNSSGYFTRLGAGNSGDILTIASGIPSWAASIVGKSLDNTNTVTLKDTNFTLQDDGDVTKQAKFQLSGISTGTTRTYTLPNVSGTLSVDSNVVHTSGNETIAGNKSFTGVNDFSAITYFSEVVVTPTGGTGNTADLQLDNMSGQVWLNSNNSGGTFAIYDNTANKTPFAIHPGAPDDALALSAGGNSMSQPLDMLGHDVYLNYGRVTEGTVFTGSPESDGFVMMPHFFNDISFNGKRGGSVIVKRNGTTVQSGADVLQESFQPDTTFPSLAYSNASDVFVIEITLYRTFYYGMRLGIVQTDWIRAKNVKIEQYNVASSSWTTCVNNTNEPFGYDMIGADAGSGGVSKLRFTLSNFTQPAPDSIRITNLFLVGFDSGLISSGFLPRGGGDMYGDIKLQSGVIDVSDNYIKGVGGLKDFNGSIILDVYAGASVANWIDIANASSGAGPILRANGTDANIDFNLDIKGTGRLKSGNVIIPTVSSTDTLTNKTLVLPGVASPTYSQGKLVYDTDNESLTFYNNDANVSLQIGQEEWVRVTNNTGSTIANGSAVYISGASGNYPTIALARSDAPATTIGAGLTTESIANGATGYITTIGIVRGVDTSAFTAGQTVYISPTAAGALTATVPSAPNYRYRIGIVGVSSASVGTIHVTPSTAALGNGGANTILGMNAAATLQEMKSITGAAGNISVTHTANTITLDVGTNMATATSSNTLTNKRVSRRVVTVTQSATPAINTDNMDVASITGLAQAVTSMTTNLTGTPVAGDRLVVEITDSGTARAITWGAKFESSTTYALPTSTLANVKLTAEFEWNSTTSAWRTIRHTGQLTALLDTSSSQTGISNKTFTTPTLTTPVINGTPSGTSIATAATASTLAFRDANKNLTTNAYIPGFTTIATSGITTVLTIASTQLQVFTGTAVQTVTLPTTSIVAGAQYTIINNSTGAVTVQSSASGLVTTLNGGTSTIVTAVVATPTTAANWTAQVFGGTTVPRVTTVTSSATPAFNTDTTDVLSITALAVAITSMSSSMTGTPANGQKLMVRIKDNGTSQTIAWGGSFTSSGVATLLANTVAGKTHSVGFNYDSVAAKWVCVAVDAGGY